MNRTLYPKNNWRLQEIAVKTASRPEAENDFGFVSETEWVGREKETI